MEETIWVITEAVNAYDQYGEYLVAVYTEKPTFDQLKKLLKKDDVTIGKLTRGGGRQDIEDSWYYLTELNVGDFYKHKN